jgi:hypothetical protein
MKIKTIVSIVAAISIITMGAIIILRKESPKKTTDIRSVREQRGEAALPAIASEHESIRATWKPPAMPKLRTREITIIRPKQKQKAQK